MYMYSDAAHRRLKTRRVHESHRWDKPYCQREKNRAATTVDIPAQTVTAPPVGGTDPVLAASWGGLFIAGVPAALPKPGFRSLFALFISAPATNLIEAEQRPLKCRRKLINKVTCLVLYRLFSCEWLLLTYHFHWPRYRYCCPLRVARHCWGGLVVNFLQVLWAQWPSVPVPRCQG